MTSTKFLLCRGFYYHRFSLKNSLRTTRKLFQTNQNRKFQDKMFSSDFILFLLERNGTKIEMMNCVVLDELGSLFLIDNLFGWQRILFHGFSVFQ
jgi:hypothetical protein